MCQENEISIQRGRGLQKTKLVLSSRPKKLYFSLKLKENYVLIDPGGQKTFPLKKCEFVLWEEHYLFCYSLEFMHSSPLFLFGLRKLFTIPDILFCN